MAFQVDGGGENRHVNYEPSSQGGLREAPQPERDYHQLVHGHLGRYQTTMTQSDYRQAGDRYRSFEDWERDDLIGNMVADMKACPEEIALRMVWHWWHCDEDYGRRVAEGAGIDLKKALALPPLPGKPAPGERRPGPTYTSGQREEGTAAAGKAREPVPAK
ncbi:catalase-related domain-containing protein [Roseomonas mucosa]